MFYKEKNKIYTEIDRRDDLKEHIDELTTRLPNFKKQQNQTSSNSTKPTNPKKP